MRDRIELCYYVYYCQGYFFILHCVCIFQTHILNSCDAKFLVPGVLGPFAFSVFLFCHPIGGHDSLKKRNIHEESKLIKKVPLVEKLPWRMSSIEH